MSPHAVAIALDQDHGLATSGRPSMARPAFGAIPASHTATQLAGKCALQIAIVPVTDQPDQLNDEQIRALLQLDEVVVK